jgi:hypothetical protein
MTDSQIEQLLAAVRALPNAERLRVAQRVVESLSVEDQLRLTGRVAAFDSAHAAASLSMLGLFADEPELVDEVCCQAYADRAPSS